MDARVARAVQALAILRAVGSSATTIEDFVNCREVLVRLPVGVDEAVDLARDYVAQYLVPPKVTLRQDLAGGTSTQTLEFAGVLWPDSLWVTITRSRAGVPVAITLHYRERSMTLSQDDIARYNAGHRSLLKDLLRYKVLSERDVGALKRYLGVCFPAWVST
jgi:hypothetical protein